MKLREHRGSLDESHATTRSLADTREALVSAVRDVLSPYGVVVTDESVRVSWYANDPRRGWGPTFIVAVDGYGIFGFTDTNPTE